MTDLSKLAPVGDGAAPRRIAADVVLGALRAAITRGDLDEGAVLSQAAIAAHFGVSRAPVREAMRQLLAEGLIETKAHHVAVVRGFSIERLGEILEHRALLEGHLVARATPRVAPILLQELHALVERMRAVSDRDAWQNDDARFHELLIRQADDATGFELVALLRGRAERCVRTWGEKGTVYLPDEAGREHLEILACVGRGDAAAARRAMVRHIRRGGERLVAHGRKMRGEA